MKCVHCENEWKINEKNSATMTKCPFCGENPQVREDQQSFENSKDALAAIYKKFGADVLLGEKLKSYFPDFMPSASKSIKKLVNSVYDSGASKILKQNLNSSQEDKERAVKIAIRNLTEDFVALEIAENIIFEFINALGWQIAIPASEPTETEKKLAEAEKKAAEAEKKAAKAEEAARKTTEEAAKKVSSTQSPSQANAPSSNSYISSLNAISSNFVHIKGGTFMMGSPANEPDRNENETQHQVTVSSFYMCNFTVTQKEYQEIVGNNPSNFKGDNLPVEQVSWFDAIEYCNKLSQKEGLTPAYKIKGTTVKWKRKVNGYRLPTEAEWEYACRAGTTTAYNTGSNFNDDTGWCKENSGITTHPVGQKLANSYGLFDMHGNVWEWCWDWHGLYPSRAKIDPTGDFVGTYRVHRGGSWGNSAEDTRSAARGCSYPDGRADRLGFRVVRP